MLGLVAEDKAPLLDKQLRFDVVKAVLAEGPSAGSLHLACTKANILQDMLFHRPQLVETPQRSTETPYGCSRRATQRS